jgi:hypothetical protein
MAIMHRLTDTFSADSQDLEKMPVSARDHFYALMRLRNEFQEKNAPIMQAMLSEILADPDLRAQYYHQLLEPLITALEKSLRAHIQLGGVRRVNIPETVHVMAGIIFGLFFLEMLGDPMANSDGGPLEEEIVSLPFEGIAPETHSPENGSFFSSLPSSQ